MGPARMDGGGRQNGADPTEQGGLALERCLEIPALSPLKIQSDLLD